MRSNDALILLDLQHDYLSGGLFPLWRMEETVEACIAAGRAASAAGMPIILIQHISPTNGSFFAEGTPGAELVDAVSRAFPDAPVIHKRFADAFHETELEDTLERLGVDGIFLAGAMTQNCVVFTALAKPAQKYAPVVLADCCTSVSEAIHTIALRGLMTRAAVLPWQKAIGEG